MTRAILCVALAIVPSAVFGQTVRLGPTFGASLLERRDTSFSHGPLLNEVTLGRTLLAGLTVDTPFNAHNHLAFEVVIGPYHNDVDRSCIRSVGGSRCELTPLTSVSRGVLYGLQYLHTFGGAKWMPYIAGGIGVKKYASREGFEPLGAMPTLSAAFGAELNRRYRLRAELRTVFVQKNPLLQGRTQTQIELQCRATLLIPVR